MISKKRLFLCALGLGLFATSLIVAAHLVVASSASGRMWALDPEHNELGLPAAAEAPPAPVALVLGARVWPSGKPSASLRDRLDAARWLWSQGKVQKVLVSGDNGQAAYNEVGAMRRWLIDHGVPSKVIYMDHAGFRTYDSMQRAARVFGVTEAIICTQAFHLPRSIFLARHAGIKAWGVAANQRMYAARWKNQLREAAARTIAVGDALVWGRTPKFLGPKVPITGPANSPAQDSP